MEGSAPSLSQPSRRQKIKGPRPTPLDVRNDSRKIIKKQLPAPPRRPVIIYTVSPKVIHANRSEFMSLVQRLTGLPSPALPPPSLQAARTYSQPPTSIGKQLVEVLDQLGIDAAMRATTETGGVQSQVPSCLPVPVPAAQRPVKSFDELCPALHGMGMSSLGDKGSRFSPNNLYVATPILPSPGACWEVFNQNQEFQ